MKEENLYSKLDKYSKSNVYPFHMPGHKRNMDYVGNGLPYNLDITEIEGFDDLHHADGIIQGMQEVAAKIFRAEESFCLINGSTVGNIAAILATTKPGDKILIARNSHNSIHSAIQMHNLNAIYLYPENIEEHGISGEILATDVKRELEANDNIAAVVIVSPTYDGVISDIEGITKIVHSHNIPLIVDEAHGAHLGLDPYFHKNSNELGADIVIHSIHKTLPALTQTALLHVNGDRINKENVRKYLRMLQSSSPSYILLAGIANCLDLLHDHTFKGKMKEYVMNLERTRTALNSMNKLRLVETGVYDKGKIVISTANAEINSKDLFIMLRNEYALELEMDGMTYVTAMTSIADTKEGFERLQFALQEIDNRINFQLNNGPNFNNNTDNCLDNNYKDIEQKAFHEMMELREKRANSISKETTNIAELFVKEGLLNKDEESTYISEHYYYLYPPGIPIIVPGEPITKRHDFLLSTFELRGYVVRKS